ncbi:MAG: hypothetical protein ACTHWA_05785 [Arachnia sp.]
MHRLRLFAININDVRDIFGADESLAVRLRALAAAQFAPQQPQKTLLGRLGPLLARNKRTEVDARLPSSFDVEALLSGGHIPHDRLPQCWPLLMLWLDTLAAHRLSVAFDSLEAVEFELARAGLDSTYSLGSLATRELGISLHPLPGQIVGYSKHAHVVEVSAHLRRVHDDAGASFGPTMHLIQPLLELIEGIAQRPEQALDLVVIEDLG